MRRAHREGGRVRVEVARAEHCTECEWRRGVRGFSRLRDRPHLLYLLIIAKKYQHPLAVHECFGILLIAKSFERVGTCVAQCLDAVGGRRDSRKPDLLR